MLYNVICYKTKEDVVYNKGTQHEKRCNTFLYRYTTNNMDDATARVKELNQMLADGVEQFDGLDFTKIAEFYLSKQEMMY